MRFIALLGVLAVSQDISEQEFGGAALIGTGGMTTPVWLSVVVSDGQCQHVPTFLMLKKSQKLK